jgi:hypothetical protein
MGLVVGQRLQLGQCVEDDAGGIRGQIASDTVVWVARALMGIRSVEPHSARMSKRRAVGMLLVRPPSTTKAWPLT